MRMPSTSAVFDGPVQKMTFGSSPSAAMAAATSGRMRRASTTATWIHGASAARRVDGAGVVEDERAGLGDGGARARDAERVVVDAVAIERGLERDGGAERGREPARERGIAVAARRALFASATPRARRGR